MITGCKQHGTERRNEREKTDKLYSESTAQGGGNGDGGVVMNAAGFFPTYLYISSRR